MDKIIWKQLFSDLRYKSIAYLPSEDSVYLSADYKSLTRIDSKEQAADIAIANRGTAEIWHMQPVGDI